MQEDAYSRSVKRIRCLGRICVLKFLRGSGKVLQNRLQHYPWSEIFLSSKILVVGIAEHNSTVATCGIRSVLNILTLYVEKQHRGRGLGKKILGKTIDAARKRGLQYILLGVYSDKPLAYHLYSTFGFKEIVHIRRPNMMFMMLPLSAKGEVAYTFLNAACSWLPKLLLSGFAQWFEARTIVGDAY